MNDLLSTGIPGTPVEFGISETEPMARVEPINERDQAERRARQRGERTVQPRSRNAVDRTPGKAEGDEETVNEALEKES